MQFWNKEQTAGNSSCSAEGGKVTHSNPPTWSFKECCMNLATQSEQGLRYFSLAPIGDSIVSSNSNPSRTPAISVSVDMQKILNFDEKLGWHWHKSWNIPTTTIKISANDKLTKEPTELPSPLNAQIFVVKEDVNAEGTTVLVDLGVKGISYQGVKGGFATFSCLKFMTTSYYHESKPFYLLFSVFQRSTNPAGRVQFLKSVISPPFFVDSRRLAREPGFNRERAAKSIKEYFSPELLNSTFYKRRTSSSREEVKIESNFEGLYNYFTARNIRGKVRHPLFLALKFNQCIKLYYNSRVLRNPSIEEIVMRLQKVLDEEAENVASQTTIQPQILPSTEFLILIETPGGKKEKISKVQELIGMNGESSKVTILRCPKKIPTHFVKVEDFKTLKRATADMLGLTSGVTSLSSKNDYSSKSERCSDRSSKYLKLDSGCQESLGEAPSLRMKKLPSIQLFECKKDCEEEMTAGYVDVLPTLFIPGRKTMLSRAFQKLEDRTALTLPLPFGIQAAQNRVVSKDAFRLSGKRSLEMAQI